MSSTQIRRVLAEHGLLLHVERPLRADFGIACEVSTDRGTRLYTLYIHEIFETLNVPAADWRSPVPMSTPMFITVLDANGVLAMLFGRPFRSELKHAASDQIVVERVQTKNLDFFSESAPNEPFGFVLSDAANVVSFLRDRPLTKRPDDFWDRSSWELAVPILEPFSIEPIKFREYEAISRIRRDAQFRKRVIGAYGNACVICGIGWGIVEAAHINPIASTISSNQPENGFAMCPNHHALFDLDLLKIDAEFNVTFGLSEKALELRSPIDQNVTLVVAIPPELNKTLVKANLRLRASLYDRNEQQQ